MQNQNRKSLILCLAAQMAILVLYGAGLVKLFINDFYGRKQLMDYMVTAQKYLPLFVILVLSILPQLTLLIKHKLHSQDGEILPILFLVISFQASLIVAEAVDAFGYVFYLSEYLVYTQRFAFLGSASLFLLSSLRYYGYASSSMSRITAVFLAYPLILATLTPLSSYKGVMALNGSSYEVFLAIAEISLYAASIITFILVAFKDGTALNIKRAVAFVLLISGIFLSRFNDIYSAVLTIVLYTPGIIILIHTAGDSI